jgi:D-3-phosphoglycerate dehydrogenase / 2-oxoglutarate reductase
VAECAVGLMLAEIRNLARSHACLKASEWRREFPNHQAIPELCGKTVGLIGYGAVGRLVAHYLGAFGSRVVVYDPILRATRDRSGGSIWTPCWRSRTLCLCTRA